MILKTNAFKLSACLFFVMFISANAQRSTKDGLEITSHAPFVTVTNYATFSDCDYGIPEKMKACFNDNLQQHFIKNFKIPTDSLSQNFNGKVYFKFFIDNDGKLDSTSVIDRVGTKFLQEEITQTLQKLPPLQVKKVQDTLVETRFVLYAKFNPGEATRFRVIDIDVSQKKIEDEEEAKKEKKPSKAAFAFVEEVPVFPGCENDPNDNFRVCFQRSMQKHIVRNFRYPTEAQDLELDGRVSIIFVINKNGGISNIRSRGPHPLLELEAERIIRLLPRMTPGKIDGNSVRVPFSIPITFKLQ